MAYYSLCLLPNWGEDEDILDLLTPEDKLALLRTTYEEEKRVILKEIEERDDISSGT